MVRGTHRQNERSQSEGTGNQQQPGKDRLLLGFLRNNHEGTRLSVLILEGLEPTLAIPSGSSWMVGNFCAALPSSSALCSWLRGLASWCASWWRARNVGGFMPPVQPWSLTRKERAQKLISVASSLDHPRVFRCCRALGGFRRSQEFNENHRRWFAFSWGKPLNK